MQIQVENRIQVCCSQQFCKDRQQDSSHNINKVSKQSYPSKINQKPVIPQNNTKLKVQLQMGQVVKNYMSSLATLEDVKRQIRFRNIQIQLQSIRQDPFHLELFQNKEIQNEELLRICQILNITNKTILRGQVQKDTLCLENTFQQSQGYLSKNSRNTIKKSLVQDLNQYLAQIKFSEDQFEGDPFCQKITDINNQP